MKYLYIVFVLVLLFPTTAQASSTSSGEAPNNSTEGITADYPSIPGYGIIGSYGYGSYVVNLESWNLYYPFEGKTYFAGDFSNRDSHNLYVLDYHWYTLEKINIEDYTTELIGTAQPRVTEEWTGLAFAQNGTAYASATWCGDSSTLYKIDIRTGEIIDAKGVKDSPCLIDIEIINGKMYGIDILYDTFIRIDPETGATTVIGALGFDANYAQGMDYDPISKTLYYAAWNDDTDSAELRTIDIVPGVIASDGIGITTLIMPINAQMEVIAFPNGLYSTFVPLVKN